MPVINAFVGVIEVTFHEDSDGFISLVGRPLTRPRTNSLASSMIREDVSSATSTAATLSELPTAEKPTDQISHGHDYCEAAAGPGHRSVENRKCIREVSKLGIALLQGIAASITTTGTLMRYRITQCDIGDFLAFTQLKQVLDLATSERCKAELQ